MYPAPKLADFGLAVETSSTEPPESNPRTLRGMGTPGFIPPEQLDWNRDEGRTQHDTPQLTTATIVSLPESVVLRRRIHLLATSTLGSTRSRSQRLLVIACG